MVTHERELSTFKISKSNYPCIVEGVSGDHQHIPLLKLQAKKAALASSLGEISPSIPLGQLRCTSSVLKHCEAYGRSVS